MFFFFLAVLIFFGCHCLSIYHILHFFFSCIVCTISMYIIHVTSHLPRDFQSILQHLIFQRDKRSNFQHHMFPHIAKDCTPVLKRLICPTSHFYNISYLQDFFSWSTNLLLQRYFDFMSTIITSHNNSHILLNWFHFRSPLVIFSSIQCIFSYCSS